MGAERQKIHETRCRKLNMEWLFGNFEACPVDLASAPNSGFNRIECPTDPAGLPPWFKTSGGAAPPVTIGAELSLQSLEPNTAPRNDTTVFCNGRGFQEDSVIVADGNVQTTTFLNENQVSALIPKNVMNPARTFQILVKNPDGSTSNSLGFTSV